MEGYLYRPKEGLTEKNNFAYFEDKPGQDKTSFWLDITGEDFESELNRAGEILDLHPLTIEDALTAENRPIVDTYQNYLFIIARIPPGDWETGEIWTYQLSLIIGPNYFLTLHRRDLSLIEKLKAKMRKDPERYFERGVDFLGYRVLDELVENYFPLLDRLEEEIDRIEDEVLVEPDEKLLMEISDLRSDLIEIQRMTGPQREMAAKLARAETPLIADNRKIYFRDIQDDLARIYDLLTNYRDLIGGARDIYMTVISNRMNEIMKTLTIVATIFIPLTFIAGIYGMNFEVMPELGWDWGYYGSLGVMGVMALGMVYYFKKKGWF